MEDRDEFVSQLEVVTEDVWEAVLPVGGVCNECSGGIRYKRVMSVLYDLSDDDATLVDDTDSPLCLATMLHPLIKKSKLMEEILREKAKKAK